MDKILLGMARIKASPNLQATIAHALGVTRAAVTKWKRVPAERVLAVEAITGISRYDLRPDIYPPPYEAVEQRLAASPPRRKHKNLSSAEA